MWRRRSCGGSAARSGRAGSRTTSPGKCPAPRRSRPRDSPKALSSMSKMTGTTLTAPLAQVETPLLAVALAQGGAVPASLAEFDRAAGGIVARAMISGDFKGKRDETALLYPGGAKPQRVLLVGLGKAGDVTRNGIRRAAAVAAKRARALDATHFAFAIAADARNGIAAGDVGQVVVEGTAQGAWAFTELKAAPDDPKAEVEAVAIACDAKEVKAVGAGERLGEAIAAGHFLTRYLQMLPGNVCTPAYLADRAKQLADQHGFSCTVLDRAEMRQENMGALLAVAQGSQQEPRFIVLEYRGAGAEGRHLRLGRRLDQAGAEHGGHEVRHVGRGGGARHVRSYRPARAAAQRRRHHPVDGEPPLRDGGQARRRGEESPGQDHRDHQHRCRGTPDPVRRAVVPAALQAGGRDRHRHAHGRGRRGARAGRDRDDGERRGPASRSPRGGGP